MIGMLFFSVEYTNPHVTLGRLNGEGKVLASFSNL